MSEIYRLGIDVGGTNTDAVILNNQNIVVAKTKTPTTVDIFSGVAKSAREVLGQLGHPASAIRFAMLSTTHCTNAIVTRMGLTRIGVIRIGAPATTSIAPLASWPQDLREAVLEASVIVGGGHEFNGDEIAPLDVDEVRRVATQWKGRVAAIAVAGVFSPVKGAHEHRVREILLEVMGPDLPITLSAEIGALGLLERENAAGLNAALHTAAQTAVRGFRDAMHEVGIRARLFLGQNDGTLMSLEQALKFPVLTIASGPANSLRGASHLTGLRDAIVIDIGGTTSDLGVLHKGFPRESSLAVEVGGVRTNFRMPDILTVGLGGGSIVSEEGCSVKIGPQSLGYKLLTEGLVFGGQTLTATDLVVAAGEAVVGDPNQVSALTPELIGKGLSTMRSLLERSVDRIKLNTQQIPVIVVGGGSILCPLSLAGVSSVIRPDHYDVANAIGVAIAQLSSTVERVISLKTASREDQHASLIDLATAQILSAGAKRESIEVLEIEEVPLGYLSGDGIRVRIKVAGSMDLQA